MIPLFFRAAPSTMAHTSSTVLSPHSGMASIRHFRPFSAARSHIAA